jgi:hypothetical protein
VVDAIATAAGGGGGAKAFVPAPFTSRPPLVPTELAVLAGAGTAAAPPRPARRK